jgi:hypothetical protein
MYNFNELKHVFAQINSTNLRISGASILLIVINASHVQYQIMEQDTQ